MELLKHMASTAWAAVLLAALASLVTEVGAGGGSGLLLVQGKLGGGTTDWDILIICVAIGAAVIFGGALIHYLWKRYKKRQAAQAGAGAGLEAGRDKARQA